MANIRPLERTLAENVTWNKARINFLAKFIIALVQVKTVSLVQISSVMQERAKPDSHYKRCQRFLRFFDLPFAEIARLVIKLLAITPPFVISIDRTDWYLGQTPLNILMLSLVYKGVAFPSCGQSWRRKVAVILLRESNSWSLGRRGFLDGDA